jgi:hypothetical protein
MHREAKNHAEFYNSPPIIYGGHKPRIPKFTPLPYLLNSMLQIEGIIASFLYQVQILAIAYLHLSNAG